MSGTDDLEFWMRCAGMVAWGALGIILAPSALASLRPVTNPVIWYRTAFFFVSLMIVGFNLRALAAADNRAIHIALYAGSVLLAIYVARMLRYAR